MTPSRRFVILDRDGTVNVERHYLADPAGVELLPRAAEGLRAMRDMGLGLVVITNQSGLGRGYFSIETLEAINARFAGLLASEGVTLDGIYWCPHMPSDGCDCRKPKPGLVHRSAADLGFDPARAFVIGDKRADIDLGHAVGATTLLVTTGYGETERHDPMVLPHVVVPDLASAADSIRRWVFSPDSDHQNYNRGRRVRDVSL